MLPLKGITEIIGESGIGKTHLAFALKGDLKTLYISLYINNMKLDENVTALRIDSFLKLKVFIAKELRKTVKEYGIEKIILDGLEDFLYVFKNPRLHSDSVFRIIKTLKKLHFLYGVVVIVINESYGSWEVDGLKIPNKYLGLPWEYMINQRYLLLRIHNQRMISLVTGNKNIHKRFSIEKGAVNFH